MNVQLTKMDTEAVIPHVNGSADHLDAFYTPSDISSLMQKVFAHFFGGPSDSQTIVWEPFIGAGDCVKEIASKHHVSVMGSDKTLDPARSSGLLQHPSFNVIKKDWFGSNGRFSPDSRISNALRDDRRVVLCTNPPFGTHPAFSGKIMDPALNTEKWNTSR